ncbi:MAG: DUF11 domain-containing protein [Burkholderiales bacterium]|nr:DUF11 domain-containing protein [Phycisphaerae bacterium]
MKNGFWISAVLSVAVLAAGCQPIKTPQTAGTSGTSTVSSNSGTSPISADAMTTTADARGEPTKAVEPLKVSGDMQSGKLYLPTGEAASSALLLETAVPAEVIANKAFDFEIKVTNISKLKLESVEVSQTVPGTLKIKDATEGSSDGKPNTLTYAAGMLNAGESKIFRLQGTATQSGAMGMCLSARYNSALCVASNVVSPALRISTAGPTEAMKCDALAYKLTVTNSGSGQAKNVKVDTVLPEGITTQDGKASLVFDAGTLDAGQSRDFAFNAKASKTGNYAIKATAKADEDLLSEAAVLTTAVKEPILALTKTGPEKAFIGQQISYDITVTNKGNAVAKNVTIFDSLPKGVTVQAASDMGKADSTGKIRWSVGDLAPAATKKVTVVVTHSEAGKLQSAASVTGECVDGTAAVMVATTLTGVPAILLEVADAPDPVQVGNKTTYTVEVTNQGTAAGTNIKLVCTLEDPMTFVSSTGETKEKVDGKVITFNTIASLAPKAKAVYKIVVQANKVGDVRFKTSMTSDQLQRPVEETEATNFYAQ